MEKELYVASTGETWTFRDDGILVVSPLIHSRIFYPYGSITKVEISFMVGFKITTQHPKYKGRALPFHKSKKAEMQELLTFVQNAIKTAPPAEVVDLNLEERMADAYYTDDSDGLHYSE